MTGVSPIRRVVGHAGAAEDFRTITAAVANEGARQVREVTDVEEVNGGLGVCVSAGPRVCEA